MICIIQMYPMVKLVLECLSAEPLNHSVNIQKHTVFPEMYKVMTRSLFDCTFTQQNEYIFETSHVLLIAFCHLYGCIFSCK